MTDEPGFAGLNDDDRRRVDRVCDEFEQAWQGQSIPAVGDFTTGFSEPALSRLIRELIQLDVEYRRRVDRGSSPAAYRAQLPEHGEVIDEALAETLRPDETVSGPDEETPGQLPGWLGAYQIIEELGRGGMGVVYKARQHSPNRIVAVKALMPGLAISDEGRQRFHRETAALAKLTHPGIVPVYEAGHSDGVYFYSMELVEGTNLHDRIAKGLLLPREAGGLVAKLARIVHYAHERGVVHRDLKPANVLLARDGEPRLTDFGLAKLAGEACELTGSYDILGTPSYMAPEQVPHEPCAMQLAERVAEESDAVARLLPSERVTIGPATDVYAIGAVLYCCLTGHPPFRAATFEETLRQVREDDPPPLPRIDRDLQTICFKCLEKSPPKRYASAQDLADDLDRFLRGEPILARPPGLIERGVRWSRRKPWRAAAAGLSFMAVALLVVLGISRTVAAERQRRQREVAEERAQHIEVLQVKAANTMSQMALEAGNFHAVVRDLNQPAWDSRYLAHAASNEPTKQAVLVEGHWGPIAAALSADGRRLVAADAGGLLVVWDIEKERTLRLLAKGRFSEEDRRYLYYFEGRDLDAHPRESWEDCFTSVCWLGKTAEVAAASMTGRVVVFDTDSGKQRTLWTGPLGSASLAVTADGKRLLVGGADGGLCLLAADGKVLKQTDAVDAGVTAMQWLATRGQWLIGYENGRVRLLRDTTLDEAAVTAAPGPVWGLDFSAVKGTLAVACAAPEAVLFEVTAEGQLRRSAVLSFPDPEHNVKALHCLLFSADGTRLYAISDTGLMIAWELGSQRAIWTKHAVEWDERLPVLVNRLTTQKPPCELPLPFRRRACALLVTDHPRELITAGNDAAIKLWDVPLSTGRADHVWASRVGPRPRLVFSGTSGRLLWALDKVGDLRAFDVETGRELARQKQAHAGGEVGLATAPGDETIVTVGGDPQVRFWRLERGRIVSAREPLSSEQPLMSVAISTDRHWIAAVDITSRLVVWNAHTDEVAYKNTVTGSASAKPLTGRIGFNLDGTYLAAFGSGQSGNVFECRRNPDAFRKLPEQIWIAGQGGTALAWNPVRSTELIVADDHPRYHSREFSDTKSGKEFHYPDPYSTGVDIVATTAKQRIVFLEEAGAITICDTRYQLPMLRLKSNVAPTSGLAVDQGGRYVAVAGQNGAIEIWDAGPVERLPSSAADDETARWSSIRLLERTSAKVFSEPRLAQIDHRDRFCLVYVESLPSDFRSEGVAYFVREADGKLLREQFAAGSREFARRLRHDSMTLWVGHAAEPTVLFRRRTAELGAYDGQLVLGTRTGPGNWTLQTIHRHGNMGFYPAIVPSRNRDGVSGVVHFSYAGCYLLQSRPSQNEEWADQPIGVQGDGYSAGHCEDALGRLHMVFRPNRFNADNGPHVYLRLDPQSGEVLREVISVRGRSELSIDLLPDGDPVVAWLQPRPDLGHDLAVLLRRRDGQWISHQNLPIRPNVGEQVFAISPKGDSYVLEWRSETRDLLLWRGVGNTWTATVITREIRESEPNWAAIRFDSRGEPVVAVGRLREPYGWLRLLRRKP